MKKTNLLKCPFCGSSPSLEKGVSRAFIYVQIKCPKCRNIGIYGNQLYLKEEVGKLVFDYVVKQWNTRGCLNEKEI